MNQINIEKYDSHDFEGMTQEKWPFTQISNYVVQNLNSLVALGIWTYMQSLPPEWKVNKKHLIEKFELSDKLYKKTMSFLKKCNLIDYIVSRDSSGTFIKTRIVVKNGSKFIHPKDHKNEAMQLNPSTNPNVFEGSTTGVKTDLVVKNDSSTRVDSHPSGYPPEWKTTPLIKKTDLKKKTINKKTTTTKADNSRFVDFQQSENISSSFIDVSPLHDFGFNVLHRDQLKDLKIPHVLVNESIRNYREALKNPTFEQTTKNKAAYFMHVMRKVGFFDLPGKKVLTPIDKKKRVIIENNVDDRYGIGML